VDTGNLIAGIFISAIWIALAVSDVRTRRIANLGTVGALALALGYRLGQTDDVFRYLVEFGACLGLVLVVYATGLVGGGDGKLMLSLLAWQPGWGTWGIVLVCLVVMGGGAMIFERVRAWLRARREGTPLSLRDLHISARYPLGSAIALAGLILVWGKGGFL